MKEKKVIETPSTTSPTLWTNRGDLRITDMSAHRESIELYGVDRPHLSFSLYCMS